jgi:Calcineurin-like phosphoesterase
LGKIFPTTVTAQSNPGTFRFTITADNRSASGFPYVLEQINSKVGGPGVFHVMPGDFAPADATWNNLRSVFGNDVLWYPVVGNHETYEDEGPEPGINNLPWLRNYYYQYLEGKVNPGPVNGEETTYSWDYGNAHFVALNVQYSGITDDSGMGAIRQRLYDWLVEDLNNNTQPVVFVFGHEPAFPQPDADDGDIRHDDDTLGDLTDDFWDLMEAKKVTAYINGHTHRYSRCQPKTSGDYKCVYTDTFLGKYNKLAKHAYPKSGSKVWQIDAGQARHKDYNQHYDTFIDVTVSMSQVIFDTWRDTNKNGDFIKFDSWSVPVEGVTPPSILQILANWLTSIFDQNGDGKVNGVDFGLVI